MGRKRTWPGTPEERADRNTVVTLIERVGRDQLRFTVADLRKRMKADGLKLHCSKDLSRHVAHIEEPGTLLVRVGARFKTPGASAPKRSKHTFVLTNRLAEYEAGHAVLELDDVERVRLALWVAFLVLEGPVQTRAVTRVLRNVLPLALEEGRQTSLYLGMLADRKDPLAEKIAVPGQRWNQWKPLGNKPEHPDMDRWVREATAFLSGSKSLADAGHATKNEMVRELIEIAVKAHSSSRWPAGRSVTIKDIRAVIHENERAAFLYDQLKRTSGDLGPVLGDVTRTTVDGRERVDQRVIKVPNPWSEATYYDVPGLPGFETRELVVAMRGLSSLLSATALHELNMEYAEASDLQNSDDPAAAAIGVMRLLHLQHELDLIGEPLQATRRKAHLLSRAERRRLDGMTARYGQLRDVRGTTAGALEDAADALKPYGLLPEEVLAVERPLLTGSEYAAWFPADKLRGRTPAEFIARARSLTRYPNPEFVDRHDPDPVKAAVTGVDRVDALVYIAQQWSTPMAGFLATGAALLGRFLRDPRLPALLLESDASYLRSQGLAALALLGDERAYEVAAQAVVDPSPRVKPKDSVFALLALRRYEADLVPERIRRKADLSLLRVLRDADRAAWEGHWLLQRSSRAVGR